MFYFQDLSAKEVELFVPDLLSSIHLEVLSHGNVTEQHTMEMAKLVEDKLRTNWPVRVLVRSQLIKEREVCLPPGLSAKYVTNNSVHKSSCIEIYYQLGMQVNNSS